MLKIIKIVDTINRANLTNSRKAVADYAKFIATPCAYTTLTDRTL